MQCLVFSYTIVKQLSCVCSRHEGIRESRGITLLILNFNTTWRWVANTRYWPLYPREKPWYPSNRRLGGLHRPSGRCEEEKNHSSLLASESRTVHPVVYSQYQFLQLQCILSNTVKWLTHIQDKARNLHMTYHWGAFTKSLLLWKSNKYYIFWVCL